MANVIKTVLTYQLDGSNRDFNIPFEYLARKFVVVTLIGVDRKVLTINTDYRFATRTTISLTKAWGPADGYTTIELRRVTSTTDRLVDFTDGSILRAYDLNVAQIQTMHVAEEARDLTADTIGVNNDGHLDARGRRIVNLANAVDDRDAVPFGQLKTMNQNSWQARNEALQFRNEAQTFRNQAEGFKNESSTNATNTNQWRDEANGFRDEAEQFKNTAGQYATSAGNSATAAHQSEVNAGNSATASANSAHLAEQHADRAEREADKLENFNGLAGAIDRVEGGSVHWGNHVYTKGEYFFDGNSSRPNNGSHLKNFSSDGRWNVIEAGDSKSYHWYSQRNNDTDPSVTFRVNGAVVANNMAADGSVTIGDQFHTRKFNADGWAWQLNDNAGFLMNPDRAHDVDSYFPLTKLKLRRSTGYPTAISFGGHQLGSDSFARATIHLCGDFDANAIFEFDINGTFYWGGNQLQGDGRLYSNTYGGFLDDWIRNNWSHAVQTFDYGVAQIWRAGGLGDGFGRVVTGIMNGNSDAIPDNFSYRTLRNVYHNGTANNIY